MEQSLLQEKLWAKSNPYKPLWMHLLEAGIVAQQLVAEGCFYPLGKELCRYLSLDEKDMLALVGYIAGVHDLGKAAGPFQEKLSFEWKNALECAGLTCEFPYFRHEDYGAYRLRSLWKQSHVYSSLKVRNRLGTVLRYHHQRTYVKNVFRKDLKYGEVDQPEWLTIQEGLDSLIR